MFSKLLSKTLIRVSSKNLESEEPERCPEMSSLICFSAIFFEFHMHQSYITC